MKPRPAEPARARLRGGLPAPLLPAISTAATAMTAAGGTVRIEALHDRYLVRRPPPTAAAAAKLVAAVLKIGCCARPIASASA